MKYNNQQYGRGGGLFLFSLKYVSTYGWNNFRQNLNKIIKIDNLIPDCELLHWFLAFNVESKVKKA